MPLISLSRMVTDVTGTVMVVARPSESNTPNSPLLAAMPPPQESLMPVTRLPLTTLETRRRLAPAAKMPPPWAAMPEVALPEIVESRMVSAVSSPA